MCQQHQNYQPRQCIIPPYLSDKVFDKASKKNLPKVINNKMRSSRFRNDRNFFGSLNKQQRTAFIAGGKITKKPQLKMQVFNMKQNTVLSNAQVIWNNGKEIIKPDKVTKNVINGCRATWNLYYEIYGRNSIDNLGMHIKQYIHYDNKYENAFWDGRRMIFGDGDGKTFGSFTLDADIIGHELTHAVIQYEANLEYHNQSGALNESLSDVFGIMIKQRLLNLDVKKSNWLIGENIVKGNKYALRNMKAPGKAFINHPDLGNDPQPATMNKYVQMPDTEEGDWGGVHYNSGIANFAFYVAAFNIGGNSWEKTGRIWYAALTDKTLKATANFADFKNLTIKKATQLFGKGSLETKAVAEGWAAAKV